MTKDIQVMIFEDDPYARDLMALLLTRDWRTHVVGELESQDDLFQVLSQEDHGVDVLILDTEIPGDLHWPFIASERLRSTPNPPVILFTATLAEARVFQHLSQIDRGGYILKSEILYSLATAVTLAASGAYVITPGVLPVATGLDLPSGSRVLDGRRTSTRLTRRERELMRLAIIFNLAQRDIADELLISPGWASEVVSTIYEKLGVREILSGDSPLDAYIENESVLSRLQMIKPREQGSKMREKFRKAPWMATLAFHLLTVPENFAA